MGKRGGEDAPAPAGEKREEPAYLGHRRRSRERFLAHGLESFRDLEALEFLLQYASPRRDTTPLARELMARYGSLANVLNAPYEELCGVKNVGENTAVLLKLIPAVSKRYMTELTPDTVRLSSVEARARYLLPHFMYERDECVAVLYMDARDRVLRTEEVGRGSVDAAPVITRRIASGALSLRASAVVLAHNHPSGDPTPSMEDIDTTQWLSAALALVGVRLLDHIIIAGSRYVSLAEYGALQARTGGAHTPESAEEKPAGS